MERENRGGSISGSNIESVEDNRINLFFLFFLSLSATRRWRTARGKAEMYRKMYSKGELVQSLGDRPDLSSFESFCSPLSCTTLREKSVIYPIENYSHL